MVSKILKKSTIILILLLLMYNNLLGSNILAKSRALTLEKGMNYPWLEEYWGGNPSINYMNYLNIRSSAGQAKLSSFKTQISLMSQMGFKTLRLPVSFDHWEDRKSPYNIDSVSYFMAIDSAIVWCNLYNMKLVIDYHHGNLYDGNFWNELPRVIELWKQIANRYKNTDPNKVFFELYNEPNGISTSNWKTAAQSIISVIRPILKNHTFILGANNWNSQYNMRDILVSDTNIIYTFHFYEPFLFTHQGASWVGGDVSTIGIPFPYDASRMPPKNPACVSSFGVSQYNGYKTQATCSNMYNSLNIAKTFSNTYNVPIWCGEWGTYKKYIPLNDRCTYTQCIKTHLDNLKIPFAYWEWNEDFSIFNNNIPSLNNIPMCMKSAMGIGQSLPCYMIIRVTHDSIIQTTHDSVIYVPCYHQ